MKYSFFCHSGKRSPAPREERGEAYPESRDEPQEYEYLNKVWSC
jgi:hypothetical protein